ncbi:MAG: acetate--CoA ligase [Bdellovibrionales bacterium]
MSEVIKKPMFKNYRKKSLCSESKYKEMYKRSIEDSDGFWTDMAKRIDWFEDFKKVQDWSFVGDVKIQWFLEGKLNASYNCIDRHLEKNGDKTAFHWVPDDSQEQALDISYLELHKQVCKLANALLSMGVKKGDRVTLYLPMIPEAVYSMLACARIGAIHSVVFAGFSPDSLAGRINDCKSDFVITADESIRCGKLTRLKNNVDEAIEKASHVKKVLVVKRTGGEINWDPIRDTWYHEIVDPASTENKPASMDSEDPLFILYTSGSTGTPKGVLHTTGGYMVYASLTHEYVFDYQPEDVYWCTADVGWITGHSYIVYGPLANAATSVIFEGTPTYPDASRHWGIVEKYNVTSYYTAPTAIRALMQKGSSFVEKHSRSSLKLLGTVGEPINPEAWNWYFETVGESRCPIVDTWWQTETGGIMITPLPSARDLKAGSATLPFFGVETALVDQNGELITEKESTGNLVLLRSWPGQMRTVYGDHDRFKKTYFSQYPGKYFTGDGVQRDEDSYLWITGRVDDVINVSGHRMGTAEIESSLVAHPDVAEAAVVGFPHAIKGQAIYAYVVLNEDILNKNHSKTLRDWVGKDIGPIAKPEVVQIADSLPKTRSGKIMRRILRNIAKSEFNNFGDISTLAESACVNELVEKRKEQHV